jgi:hypothetical protein
LPSCGRTCALPIGPIPIEAVGALEEDELPDAAPLPPPALTPLERRSFDYTAPEEAMAHPDAVVRRTRHILTRRGPVMSSAPEPRPIDHQAANTLVEEENTNVTQLAIPR